MRLRNGPLLGLLLPLGIVPSQAGVTLARAPRLKAVRREGFSVVTTRAPMPCPRVVAVSLVQPIRHVPIGCQRAFLRHLESWERLARLPARAWRILRDEGLGSAWFRFLYVLGYRRLFVLRRPLGEPIPSCLARLPLAIAWLTREELDAYRSFRAGGNNAARLLAEGDRCLIACHEGRIVGALWSSTRCARSGTLDRDLPLAPGEAFEFNTFTAGAERGQGVASALSAAWLRKMREEGCTAALTLAQPENRAALRTHARVGFRITGLVRSLQLGPWRYHWPIQLIPGATASSIHDGSTHVP